MKTIWKFALTPDCTLKMPIGAEILTVQEQNGRPQIWALVDPEAGTERRRFRACGTGRVITEPTGEYVGTFQLNGGALVFHVFEVPK